MRSLSKLVIPGICLCAWLSRIAMAQEAGSELKPEAEAAIEAEQVDGNRLELTFDLDQSVAAGNVLVRLAPVTFGNPFGVDVAVVDDILRSQLDIAEGTGVVITAVADDSEAARAGFKPHDIVLQINGQPVAGPEPFNAAVAERQGQAVTIDCLRRGQPLKIEVTLPKTPEYDLALTEQVLFNTSGAAPVQHFRIGVTLAEADDTLRSQLRLAAGEGLVVTEVIDDSPAAQAGLREHDVLTKLDGKRLSTVENINAQIQEIGERQAALDYIRAGEEQTSEVTPRLSQDESRAVEVRLSDLANRQSLDSWAIARARRTTADTAIRWLMRQQMVDPNAVQTPATADVAGQIEELKRKLADITESLNALSTALQPPAQEDKPAGDPQPEEAKRE